jgi:hypothetical protein
VRPLGELAGDLAAGAIADYNFITPNVCHDMSGQDSGTACPADLIRAGDDWLAATIPPISVSLAYKSGGAIFVVWEEGTSGTDGPLGLIVLSPKAKPGYVTDAGYDHSSLLRTVQDALGVRPYLGAAASARDLGELFASP